MGYFGYQIFPSGSFYTLAKKGNMDGELQKIFLSNRLSNRLSPVCVRTIVTSYLLFNASFNFMSADSSRSCVYFDCIYRTCFLWVYSLHLDFFLCWNVVMEWEMKINSCFYCSWKRSSNSSNETGNNSLRKTISQPIFFFFFHWLDL